MMDETGLQHQQELENQEILLGFLVRVWKSESLTAAESLTLASFMGLKKEFIKELESYPERMTTNDRA